MQLKLINNYLLSACSRKTGQRPDSVQPHTGNYISINTNTYITQLFNVISVFIPRDDVFTLIFKSKHCYWTTALSSASKYALNVGNGLS